VKRTTKSILFSTITAALGIAVLIAEPASGGPGGREKAMKKFAQLDKNKNNQVERTEFPGDDQLWQRADRNGDGVMSFDEGLGFVIEQEVEKIFMKLDTDRDGFIRLAEITNPKQRSNFTKVDSNADGKLSGQEVLKAVTAQYNNEGKSAQAGKKGQLKLPPKWEEIIRHHDHNGDGKIQAEELKGKTPDKTFARLDINNDQVLTGDEYNKSRKRYVHVIKSTQHISKLMETFGKDIGKSLKDADIDTAEAQLQKLQNDLRKLLKLKDRQAH
jgi:Ca2+-binding EF-hand superfamily protein